MVQRILCALVMCFAYLSATACTYQTELSASENVEASYLKVKVAESTVVSPLVIREITHHFQKDTDKAQLLSLLADTKENIAIPGGISYLVDEQKIEPSYMPITIANFTTDLSTNHTNYKVVSITPHIPTKIKMNVEEALNQKLMKEAQIYANRLATTNHEKIEISLLLISFSITPANHSSDMALISINDDFEVPLDQTITASATVSFIGSNAKHV